MAFATISYAQEEGYGEEDPYAEEVAVEEVEVVEEAPKESSFDLNEKCVVNLMGIAHQTSNTIYNILALTDALDAGVGNDTW